MLDIGTMVIQVTAGVARVVRVAPSDGDGIRFIPAKNAAALAADLQRVLTTQGVALADDGLYPCPVQVQTAAQFDPWAVPSDLITFAAARDMLYPDLNPKTGWARVHTAVDKGQLRAYEIGSGMDAKRFVSRADVQALVDQTQTLRSAHV